MQKVKTTVSIVVILVALAFIAVRSIGFSPNVDARPHRGIGKALADEAAKLARSGGRIILIAPDIKVFRYPGAEVQLKEFRAALRDANLQIVSTNWVKLDPLRPAAAPAGDFFMLLKKYAEPDVIVSLLGPATLNSDQKSKLPPKHARVVAVCSGDMPKQMNLQALFEDNLLHAAIISRPSVSATKPPTDEPQKWFDYLYQVVTAKNLHDLPPNTSRPAAP
jgi:hypothetical protein